MKMFVVKGEDDKNVGDGEDKDERRGSSKGDKR